MQNVQFLKRELIEVSINDIKFITLIIKPQKELLQAFLKHEIIELFQENGVKDTLINEEFQHYAINVWFPEYYQNGKNNIMSELCFVCFDCRNIPDKNSIIENLNVIETKLTERFIGIYETNCIPALVLGMLDLDRDYNFGLSEFLKTLNISQKEFCEKTDFSKGFVSDVCTGRQDISLNMLKKIKEMYPLSFWEFLI